MQRVLPPPAGGVGGGLLADRLSKTGGRYWLTAGMSLASAPFIALSLLADSPQESFAYLLVGFALSECWRAPAAVMIRGIAPQVRPLSIFYTIC